MNKIFIKMEREEIEKKNLFLKITREQHFTSATVHAGSVHHQRGEELHG
jgi:hypothetical protein